MSLSETTGVIAQTAGMIVVAILGMIFGIQKILKGWNESSTETSVLKTMHEELTRMASHNKILGEELNKFQLEVLRLNNQLTELTLENRRLHSEIVSLTEEVTRLQTIINEIRNK